MKKDKHIYWRATACVLCCWFIYLFFSFTSWHEPVMGDEVRAIMWIKSLRDSSITNYFVSCGERLFGVWHPPAYACLAAILGDFFTLNEMVIRAIGIASFLISLALIYVIAYGLFKKDDGRERIAILACIIYALNPLAVKGSLLIDIDGTILNVAILALIAALVWIKYDKGSRKAFFIYTALFTLALCIKLSNPFIFIGAIFTCQVLRREWQKLLYTAKIAISGVALASIIWFLYCLANGRDAACIIEVPISIVVMFFLRNASGEGLSLIARNIWALLIWSSPSFIILGLIGSWKNFDKPSEDDSLLSLSQFAFCGLAFFIIYIFIGGVTHSFPKYHYAVLPIFSILASGIFVKDVNQDRRLLAGIAALVSMVVLYYIFFVKDPLYLVNYALKEAVIKGPDASVHAIIREEAVRVAFLLLAIPVIFLFYIKRKKAKEAFILALFVTMFACNISLLTVQRAALYNSAYCYGAEGVREVSDFILANTLPSDIICAPPEILLSSKRKMPSYGMAKTLNGKDLFLNGLKANDVKCVVYGITGNTVDQYRKIFYAADVKAFLNENYVPREIGSYTVWLKKRR